MRIKSLLFCMLLMCSLTVFPLYAQDGDEEAPEFTLGDEQAVTYEEEDGTEVTRDAASIRAEMEATGALYIIIRGRFVYAVWSGHVLYIRCRPYPRTCAIIKV